MTQDEARRAGMRPDTPPGAGAESGRGMSDSNADVANRGPTPTSTYTGTAQSAATVQASWVDGTVLERLFELYEQKMYRVAFAILHDAGQAEDAVMNAFEKVARRGRMDAEPESSEVKRLMLSIIRSCAIDLYRKNARERARVVPLADAFERADACEEPLAAAVGGFQEMISPLPEGYRAVVDARIGQGKTVRETAADLGISEAAVRKRQQRAVQMLKDSEGGAR